MKVLQEQPAVIICLSDENFREFAKEWIKVATSGVDLIMFGDDYRYGFEYEHGCHVKAIFCI